MRGYISTASCPALSSRLRLLRRSTHRRPGADPPICSSAPSPAPVSTVVGGETITCPFAHGEMDINDAFRQLLQRRICSSWLTSWARRPSPSTQTGGPAGPLSVSGIPHQLRSVELDGATSGQLGWAGVGQYHDLVTLCPDGMDGRSSQWRKAAVPELVLKTDGGFPTSPSISPPHQSADPGGYRPGAGRYDGPERGTDLWRGPLPQHGSLRQIGHRRGRGGKQPSSWFTGFLREQGFPLRLRRGGGGGRQQARARQEMWPPRCWTLWSTDIDPERLPEALSAALLTQRTPCAAQAFPPQAENLGAGRIYFARALKFQGCRPQSGRSLKKAMTPGHGFLQRPLQMDLPKSARLSADKPYRPSVTAAPCAAQAFPPQAEPWRKGEFTSPEHFDLRGIQK